MADERVRAGGKDARIIHHDSAVEDWILHAQEMGWEQGSNPTVFVTYTGVDSKWVGVLARWCSPELRNTGQPHKLDYYSGSEGTTDSRPYPSTLAAQLWRSRGAIMVVSQDCFRSPTSHSIEMPFLGLAAGCIPLCASRGADNRGDIAYRDSIDWRQVADLASERGPADYRPRFNAGLPLDHGGVLIAQLPDDQQDRRMQAFAEAVVKRPFARAARGTKFCLIVLP